jgi:hypothetical protein
MPFIDGNVAASTFYNPRGIAVDAGGNVIVADNGNNRIRKIFPYLPGMIGQNIPQVGTDFAQLKLIKAGSIVNVDESYNNGMTFVSATDKLLLTLDQSGYKYYVNNVIVGKSSITPTIASNVVCFITAMQNQTGVSTATTIRQAGITNVIVGQYNTSTGYEAVPLLLGGNRPVNIKPLNTKATSFKIVRKKRTSGKTAVKRR